MDVITVGPGLAARSFPGDGRPVLLVHGLSSNARLWDAVARHLDGHPVVAVDLRGHGASAEVPDVEPDATLAAAHDLAARMRRPRLERAGRRGPVVGRQRGAPTRG